MNIETSKIKQINNNLPKQSQSEVKDSEINFSEELKDLKKNQELNNEKGTIEKDSIKNNNELNNNQEKIEEDKLLYRDLSNKNLHIKNKKNNNEDVENSVNDLKNTFKEMSTITNKFHQSDDKSPILVKDNNVFDDKTDMINNDFNISENKDLLPQMNPNMNFSGDGQPFSSFMQNSAQQNQGNKLGNSVVDLAEESAILSSMAENIAIANKNNIIASADNTVDEKVVNRNDDIKKVDVKSGVVIETVVKHDSIIMNQADVEMFANLVEKGDINLNNITSETAIKSVKVSKTLADMLIKAKETNQPLRIDFDNNISVIIKISREGKITADFLPSSQVAEAYLKENLPLLRQRFDDNNIKYDELNQRERKDQNKEQNRKKGRNDE